MEHPPVLANRHDANQFETWLELDGLTEGDRRFHTQIASIKTEHACAKE